VDASATSAMQARTSPRRQSRFVGHAAEPPRTAAEDPRPRMERSSIRDRRFVLILAGFAGMAPLSTDMYIAALPRVATDLETTPGAAQLTLTGFFVGLGIGQLLAGPASDVLGRRGPLLCGALVYTAAAAACALAPSIEVLVAARLVQGVGAAAGIAVSRAIMRDLYAGSRLARSFSRLFVFVALVPVLAPLIGSQLLRFTTWRGIFISLFAFGFALFIIATYRVPETLPPGRRNPAGLERWSGTLRFLLAEREFVGYSSSLACGTAAVVVAVAASPFVVQEGYGASPQVYGLVFVVAAVALMAATHLNTYLLRIFSARALLLAGLVIGTAAGGLVTLVGGRTLFAFAACFALVLASWGLMGANAVALALRPYPALAGSAAALVGVFQYVPGGVLAPLSGLIGSTTRSLGLLIACLGATGLAAAGLTVRRDDLRDVAVASDTSLFITPDRT
jgi:DHA1 family bicyclomycin/chloramphenicol resistance-like MFS transporter